MVIFARLSRIKLRGQGGLLTNMEWFPLFGVQIKKQRGH